MSEIKIEFNKLMKDMKSIEQEIDQHVKKYDDKAALEAQSRLNATHRRFCEILPEYLKEMNITKG